jgi:hypothetical protein
MGGISEALVALAAVYAAAGLAFAVFFVTSGIHRVDSQAKGSSAGFRLIIIPGVAALWPFLLLRTIRGDAS